MLGIIVELVWTYLAERGVPAVVKLSEHQRSVWDAVSKTKLLCRDVTVGTTVVRAASKDRVYEDF